MAAKKASAKKTTPAKKAVSKTGSANAAEQRVLKGRNTRSANAAEMRANKNRQVTGPGDNFTAAVTDQKARKAGAAARYKHSKYGTPVGPTQVYKDKMGGAPYATSTQVRTKRGKIGTVHTYGPNTWMTQNSVEKKGKKK